MVAVRKGALLRKGGHKLVLDQDPLATVNAIYRLVE